MREFHGEWVIIRPGAVYGPGDEHLSLMLRMIRTLPVVPGPRARSAGSADCRRRSSHPLAGAVRFVTLPIAGGVHFEVQVFDRPANFVDWMLMRPIGDRMQEATWQELAATVARVAGATNPEVKHIVRDLDAAAAKTVEEWAKALAMKPSAWRRRPRFPTPERPAELALRALGGFAFLEDHVERT